MKKLIFLILMSLLTVATFGQTTKTTTLIILTTTTNTKRASKAKRLPPLPDFYQGWDKIGQTENADLLISREYFANRTLPPELRKILPNVRAFSLTLRRITKYEVADLELRSECRSPRPLVAINNVTAFNFKSRHIIKYLPNENDYSNQVLKTYVEDVSNAVAIATCGDKN